MLGQTLHPPVPRKRASLPSREAELTCWASRPARGCKSAEA
jgi:hypothetical protein